MTKYLILFSFLFVLFVVMSKIKKSISVEVNLETFFRNFFVVHRFARVTIMFLLGGVLLNYFILTIIYLVTLEVFLLLIVKKPELFFPDIFWRKFILCLKLLNILIFLMYHENLFIALSINYLLSVIQVRFFTEYLLEYDLSQAINLFFMIKGEPHLTGYSQLNYTRPGILTRRSKRTLKEFFLLKNKLNLKIKSLIVLILKLFLK